MTPRGGGAAAGADAFRTGGAGARETLGGAGDPPGRLGGGGIDGGTLRTGGAGGLEASGGAGVLEGAAGGRGGSDFGGGFTALVARGGVGAAGFLGEEAGGDFELDPMGPCYQGNARSSPTRNVALLDD